MKDQAEDTVAHATESIVEDKKAYDLKLLMVHLKAQGLDLAEEAVAKAYGATMDWLEESARISKTPFDDIIPVVRGQVDALVLPLIDKIDGEDDAGR